MSAFKVILISLFGHMQTAQQAQNPDELSHDKADMANVLAKTSNQQVWSNISIHLTSYFWPLSESKSNSR